MGYQFHKGPPETRTRNGKAALFFGKAAEKLLREHGESHEIVTLPCGRCIYCVMRKSGDWALRCVHEMGFWDTGCFLTLTYATHKLVYRNPDSADKATIVKKHFQDFMKRLREHITRKENGHEIKYFACGEYGDKTERPHYHSLVFGWKPSDLEPVPNNPGTTDPLYDSKTVEKLWGHGRVRIGTLTARSAAYVARYTVKKQYGEFGEREYELTGRIPPFLLCSQGIGRDYFLRWRADIYPSDFIVDEEDFRRHAVPRFYDKLLEAADLKQYEAVKRKRREKQSANYKPEENTALRLQVREEALEKRFQFAKVRSGTDQA